jgi:formylglycine-generating enzyme
MNAKNLLFTPVFLSTFFLTDTVSAQKYPEMVIVPGGTFKMGDKMGDGNADELPVHSVTLKSFNMARTETTVIQWEIYCNDVGKDMPDAPLWGWNDDDPVVNVSWNDAVAYCAWLSKKTGDSCRLPTEAEYEYAARGGRIGNGFKYSGSDKIDTVAWYADNSGGHPDPVASKIPNELGLYDMSGNVWEWCSDWYAPYTADPATNPQGPKDGSYRVLRGGSWNFSATYSRVARRNAYAPGLDFLTGGFRVVSSAKQ